jgi:1-acyl-sn-glycerol-3-phosphate acyltransferase
MEPPRLTLFWHTIRWVAELIVRLMGWRVDVQGLERVPRRGGAVLAFNHHSYFDFVMVAWDVVRKVERPVRFLAKREIWSSRWAGWIVRLGGAVPVDRTDTTSRHGAFTAAVEALERGELVAVAPEQTISPSFELLPFRTGAVRMAKAAGVPIVPVIGWGTQRFATKGTKLRLARRIPVVVRYGEPVHVGPDDDPVVITATLQERMEAMLDEVQRSYPDRPRPGDDAWAPARLGGSAPTHAEVLAAHRRRTEGWVEGREPGEPGAPPTAG